MLALIPALVVAGCPAKELLLDISAEGISYIVKACARNCDNSDPKTICCPPEGGQKDSPRPLAFQLSLVTRDADGARHIRARGPCIELPLGCPAELEGGKPGYCMQVQINDLLQQNMAGGLGFDGMDPADTELILTLHRSAAELDASGHEIPDTAPPTECVPDDLFACAALDQTDETYDIVCASCSGQPPIVAFEFDIEEVACFGHCFVNRCHDLLEEAIARGR